MNIMNAKRTAAFAVVLTVLVSALAFSPAASARVYVSGGVRVFAPLPPIRHEVVIARPGPRYVWVPGYWRWDPYPRHYVWVGGSWLLPPYPGAVWYGPRVVYRYHHPYYYGGYWGHGHGYYGHGHGHGHGRRW
jgi:hypothetical protein